MKLYTPEKLVAVSRYQNFFPTLPVEIQRDVYARMSVLLTEEKAYCDQGNYKHMAQILTSIALYEALQSHGKSEAEAYKIVSEEMWKFLDPSGMQKLAKKSFFLPLMKKIVPFGFKKGSGTGWRYTWHQDGPKDEFRFECNECIYFKILGKRNLLKLGIHVEHTKAHFIYASKMGEKYLKRYRKYFRNPEIRTFDMQHEQWLFGGEQYTGPVLQAIDEFMEV